MRRLGATLLDAALKQPESLQPGKRAGTVIGLDKMQKGAVAKLQGHVANTFRRFFPQFLKHVLDQALVLRRPLRSGLLPQFLQTAQDHGPFGAGLRLLPWTATLFLVAPIAGGLVNRIGERPLVVIGLILQASGLAWIGLIAAPDLVYAEFAAPLILAGAGASMAMPAVQNAAISAVAPAEIGKASGTFNMMRFLGGAFGIAILVAVFAAAGSVGSPQAFSAGFARAIEVAAALSLLGAVAGMWQPARRETSLVQAEANA